MNEILLTKPQEHARARRNERLRMLRYRKNSVYRGRLKGTLFLYALEYHFSFHARRAINARSYEKRTGSVCVRPNPSYDAEARGARGIDVV